MMDKTVIKEALIEAIKRRGNEASQLTAELEKIEREEVEQQAWLDRHIAEAK